MFPVEMQKESRLEHLMKLNVIGILELLLHDARAKGIREATQPDEESSSSDCANGAIEYSIGAMEYANGVLCHQFYI